MTDLTAIAALVEPEAKALGFDLVRVRWFSNGTQEGDEPTLQVMAERPDTGQLNIDDCADLSHRLSDLFDRLEEEGKDPFEEAYRLEVSSPGIDRPLTRLKDYRDWQGHEARAELIEESDGRKRYRGLLGPVDEAAGTITITDRDNVTHIVPFGAIGDAKLVLTDKLIAATRPIDTTGVDEIEELDDSNESETED